MPHPVQTWQERLYEGSPVFVAYAVRRKYIDGRQHVDIRAPETGHWADDCPVFGLSPDPIAAPETEFTGEIDPALHPQVLACIVTHERQVPIVFGPISGPVAYEKRTNQPAADDDIVVPDAAYHGDKVIEVGGSRVTLRENGDVVIAAKGNVTFSSAGPVRVPGRDADDAAAVASATVEAIDKLAEAIRGLQLWARFLAINTATMKPLKEYTEEDVTVDSDRIPSALLKLGSETDGGE